MRCVASGRRSIENTVAANRDTATSGSGWIPDVKIQTGLAYWRIGFAKGDPGVAAICRRGYVSDTPERNA
jgi:hypothetical protein